MSGLLKGGYMNYLKKFRIESGFSQKQLAQQLGLSETTISLYESGKRTPNPKTLEKMADCLHTSVDHLLGRGGVQIPVLGSVQAGVPIQAIEEILDYEEIPASLAEKGEFFALRIRGSSMEPKMSEGDIVIIKSQSDVQSGQIAVVLVNGDEATVKKLIKHDAGITLMPLNPGFAPVVYSHREIEQLPVTVLGRVIELRCKF